MRSVTVTLGGQDYEVSALPIRQSAAWRRRLTEPLAEITALIDGVGSLRADVATAADDRARGEQFLRGLAQVNLAQVLNTVRSTVLEAPELITELLFDFSPVLQADRERIEAEAYDEEVVAAFLAVLKLAYPFGGLMGLLSSRATSKTPLAASTNSRAPNGVSGRTN